MTEAVRNAAVLGAVAAVVLALAQLRGAWKFLPALVLLGVGVAWKLDALRPIWAFDSLRADAPWLAALGLAVWSVHGATGWVRPRGWAATVALAAVFGDVFTALGLAVAEPDASRRARLVLAASGASLIGITSGASPLLLGWGGFECVAIGLALAAVGFVGGPTTVERAPVQFRPAALVVPLCGAVLVWLGMLGGGLELVATGLEQLPLQAWSHGHLVAYAGALVGAALGDEGLLALHVREILARGLSLRGDDTAMALRAGLAVGGGVPLLVLTRSRLRVGIPLWLLQASMAAAWLFLR